MKIPGLSPALALGLVRTELEGKLNKDVPNFTLVVNLLENVLTFEIEGDNYPGGKCGMVGDAVKGFVMSDLPKGSEIHMVKINVIGDTGNADVFFLFENAKKKLTINF
jgi:hypothetical protein